MRLEEEEEEEEPDSVIIENAQLLY